MENSIQKIGREENSKARSLDPHKSRISKEGKSKSKNFVEEYDAEVRTEKKKRKSSSRKADETLSRFEPEVKKSRKSSDGENKNGVRSREVDLDQSVPSLSQKLNSSGASIGISLSFDQHGNVFRIPKRPRGSVRRRKFEGDSASKPLGEADSVDPVTSINGEVKKGEGDRVSKLPGSSGGEAGSSDSIFGNLLGSSASDVVIAKVKQKTNGRRGKECRNTSVGLARHGEEDGLLVVNNGDTSSRKCRSNCRKRKNMPSGSGTIAEKAEPPVVGTCVDFPEDDDEENLEQNAARMLSSRFDPSCTGFSSKTRSSLSPSTNGFSFMITSDQDFVDRDMNSLAGSESSSVDNSNRVLRPRKQHKGKGLSRKRRHYYEIIPRDLDAYWVLNRRIKVFWPLDKSWYYGLLNDYDREKELHHIKYDDRDEEWVNLQQEKFKLLLLPEEVPGKAEVKVSTGVKTYNKAKTATGDVQMGNCLDSEPIISWLPRSSRRGQHSPSSPLKKQKLSELPLSTKSSFSFDKLNDTKGNVSSLVKRGTEIGGGLALHDRFTDGGKSEKSSPERPSGFEVRKTIVYFRKRFRKKCEEISSACGNVKASKISPGTLTSLVPEACSSQTWKENESSSLGCSDTDKLLCIFDDSDTLRLSMQLKESEGHNFQICFRPFLGAEHLWLSRIMLLLHYGAITTRWPAVMLEMLFVDNIVGMRSLLFEGSMESAVAFLFLILSVFKQHTGKQNIVDLQLPVTSIRIRLSSVRDPRKQHVFAFYIFSKLKRSKWLYLDAELQRHCLLSQKLPLSECTYGNMKALEGGSYQLDTPLAGSDLFICEDLQNSRQDAMPISKEPCGTMMGNSAFSFAIKPGKLSPFAVSFTAVPTFFLSLHLKMLMNRSFACISLEDVDSISSLEGSENTSRPTPEELRQVPFLEKDMVIIPVSHKESSLTDAASSTCLTAVQPLLEKDVISASGDVDDMKSSQDSQKGKIYVAESFASSKPIEKNATEAALESHKCECDSQAFELFNSPSQPCVTRTVISPILPSARGYSSLGGRSVEIPSLDQVERSLDERAHLSRQASDLTLNLTNVHSPHATGPRSSWQRNRSSVSSPLGDLSPVCPDGKTNIISGVFSNGPKKRRTQVQYTMPLGGYDLSSNQKFQNQRPLPYKRIRRADDKRTSDGSRNSRKNLELSACDANVLVTIGDKGWREYGARVVLGLVDHNEWRLAIRLSGVMKYSYKVNNILQPGSTNRYTHAMMWKGGKDWVLEFPDRSQWMLFKEMHEECYNRNIRAASVKNIPIPGVRLIEESDYCATNVSFIRHSAKYFRQAENDVEMAMNPSRVLYDMDSEDEQWLSENKRALCTDEDNGGEISDEEFEKTMDMFEKSAYAQQREHFVSDEIEKLMVGVRSTEVAKVIYEHWRQKRQRKTMALIRHLQPPLWKKYQQQVNEWEQAGSRPNTALSGGCQDRALLEEKPPTFAFCLKPRGMEIPNKGSKQKSQKRLPVALHNHVVSRDQDGRRLHGVAFGDERVAFPGNCQDSSEALPSLPAPIRAFSPRDASGPGYFSLSNDVSEWKHPLKHRNVAKKIGGFPSPSNQSMVASYNQRTIGKRNGIHQWSMDTPKWPSQKHHYPEGSYRHSIRQLDSSDLQEFRLRDASGAAQHALKMAKLTRERAERLLCRADLAIHKAVVAISTAEAVKAAFENPNGDG